MRRYDLGEEGSGASDVIRYDARKVAEFIADMEACMSSYNTKASALESEYSRYYNNHTYVGKAAEASKEFINNGQIERLHYGHHFLMERLYKRYVDIDEAFKAIVDRAPNARVDTEVMKKDKRDFCVYSDVTTDDSHFIESHAEEIKDRFEKYLEGEKGVRVPDYKPARRTYEELCGDGGQIDKSIKKCFEFDDEALSAINRSGLEEQIYDLTEDITNTANILDGFQVYSPDVGKTTIGLISPGAANAKWMQLGSTVGNDFSSNISLMACSSNNNADERDPAIIAALLAGTAAAVYSVEMLKSVTGLSMSVICSASATKDAVEKMLKELHDNGITDDEIEEALVNPNVTLSTLVENIEKRASRIGTVDPFFIQVEGKDSNGDVKTYFGGDQGWCSDDGGLGAAIGNNGCGVVASVNQYLYLTGQTNISQEEYEKLIYGFIYAEDEPFFTRGINAYTRIIAVGGPTGALPKQMTNYVEAMCDDKNVNVSSSWDYFQGYETDYKNMKNQLENGVPVVWAMHDWHDSITKDCDGVTYYTYDCATGDYVDSRSRVSSHYVVATALYEDIDSSGKKRRMVEVSSWGTKYYVDYDEYVGLVSKNCMNRPFSSITNTSVEGD